MKILIPTYNRPFDLTTPWLLEASGYDYNLIVNDEQQYELYRQNPRIRPESIRVIGKTCHGPNYGREFARSQVEYGEWCMMLDDNVTMFTRTIDRYYGDEFMPDWKKYEQHWRDDMNMEITFKEWMDVVVADSLAKARETGARIVGFAPLENPFFRKKKWLHVGYVIAKGILIQKTDLLWDQCNEFGMMEEYALCAAQHLEYGRVLINKFAMPHCVHYLPGGCGPYNERLPAKIAACTDYMERFPQFFRYSSKKAGVREGELRIRFTMLKQVEKWQTWMREQGLDPLKRDPLTTEQKVILASLMNREEVSV